MITPAATQFLQTNEPFTFASGDVLPSLTLAYETWGSLNQAGDNAILIFPGMSPTAHVAANEADPSKGWWQGMVGPDRTIDTNHYFVVCVNSLGSCFGSTGPTSINPDTGEHYGADFPDLAIDDIAASYRYVIDALGIKSVYAGVAPSMGGTIGLAFSILNPGLVKRMALISTALASTPFSMALRKIQRDVIRCDPKFKQGRYALNEQPICGMRQARKLAMTTYRSAIEWQVRFGREQVEPVPEGKHAPYFQVDSYLDARADDFIQRFDANSYMRLSRALDVFNTADFANGDMQKALTQAQWQHVLVMGTQSDTLFPFEQQMAMHYYLTQAGFNSKLESIASDKGHDAFLADKKMFYAPVKALLAD